MNRLYGWTTRRDEERPAGSDELPHQMQLIGLTGTAGCWSDGSSAVARNDAAQTAVEYLYDTHGSASRPDRFDDRVGYIGGMSQPVGSSGSDQVGSGTKSQ